MFVTNGRLLEAWSSLHKHFPVFKQCYCCLVLCVCIMRIRFIFQVKCLTRLFSLSGLAHGFATGCDLSVQKISHYVNSQLAVPLFSCVAYEDSLLIVYFTTPFQLHSLHTIELLVDVEWLLCTDGFVACFMDTCLGTEENKETQYN
jgi:hypothetical protein